MWYCYSARSKPFSVIAHIMISLVSGCKNSCQCRWPTPCQFGFKSRLGPLCHIVAGFPHLACLDSSHACFLQELPDDPDFEGGRRCNSISQPISGGFFWKSGSGHVCQVQWFQGCWLFKWPGMCHCQVKWGEKGWWKPNSVWGPGRGWRNLYGNSQCQHDSPWYCSNHEAHLRSHGSQAEEGPVGSRSSWWRWGDSCSGGEWWWWVYVILWFTGNFDPRGDSSCSSSLIVILDALSCVPIYLTSFDWSCHDTEVSRVSL